MSQAEPKLLINGILLVNKPQGLTSNAVLQKVKRLFRAKKAGHTGSLDPLATGMLPICFGEGTKFCQYLLDADKAYAATGLLGIKTNTADAQGEIISQVHNFHVPVEKLTQIIQEFIGEISQTPSMFSALKHQGQPLYRLARAGITIERKARNIHIKKIVVTHFDGHNFGIEVDCSKGTYIRNLVEDIGEKLGVHAHVTQLHRRHTTGFENEPMFSLEALTDMNDKERHACLLPIERAIHYLPIITLTNEEAGLLKQGKQIPAPHYPVVQGYVRLYEVNTGFMGLGEFNEAHELMVKRLLAF